MLRFEALDASCVCSGSSASSTEAYMNAPISQPHHLSYAGSDTSTACHPSSLYDFNPIIHGWKRPKGRPKRDGLIPSSTISILLASTPPMLPIWYMTDPSRRSLLADCQRSNQSKALKSSKSSIVCFNVSVLWSSLRWNHNLICKY